MLKTRTGMSLSSFGLKDASSFFLDHPNCAINSEYSIPPPPLALPYRNNPTLPIKRKNPWTCSGLEIKSVPFVSPSFLLPLICTSVRMCVRVDRRTYPPRSSCERTCAGALNLRVPCAAGTLGTRRSIPSGLTTKKCWPAKTNKQTNLLNDTTTTMIVTWFYHTKNMITSPINRWKPIKNEKKQQCYTHYTQHTTRYTRIHNTHYYMNIYNCDCEEMINY